MNVSSWSVVIVHRNHFIYLHQQNKTSESKVKFRQASNCCRRVLEAAKLVYAHKTKESIIPKKVGFCEFWQIPNSILNKGKSAIPSLFNDLEVLPSAFDKTKLKKNFKVFLQKTFFGISDICPFFVFLSNRHLQMVLDKTVHRNTQLMLKFLKALFFSYTFHTIH